MPFTECLSEEHYARSDHYREKKKNLASRKRCLRNISIKCTINDSETREFMASYKNTLEKFTNHQGVDYKDEYDR